MRRDIQTSETRQHLEPQRWNAYSSFDPEIAAYKKGAGPTMLTETADYLQCLFGNSTLPTNAATVSHMAETKILQNNRERFNDAWIPRRRHTMGY